VSLADLARNVGRTTTTQGREVADIITFIEAPWGLDFKLFPVQRVILKVHYGLALDDNEFDYPLDAPVPEDHPHYDPEVLDHDGYYKHRLVISDWQRKNYQYLTEAGYLRYLHDDGRCNVREVVPGHERREMILSVGRRSGKCLKAGSLVLTSKGVLPIESLGDPEGPEHQPCRITVAQEGRQTTAESAYFYNGGVREIRDLKTYCGFRLGGTPNHRIKVMSPEGFVVWKYLGDVEEGDFVAIHRGTNLWPQEYLDVSPYWSDLGRKDLSLPTHLTEEWGLLLGALVGDGSWTRDRVVELTVACPEFRVEMKALWTRLFGGFKEQGVGHSPKTTRIQFHSLGARQFLHDLGWVYDADRRSKMVPWSVMQSTAPVVRAFLRGLFETDGGMESNGKVVSFCSASERLAHEVQTLLLNLGIVSRIRAKWNKTYERNYYILIVRGLRHRQMFAERVGFVSRRKMEPLWAGLKSSSREGGNSESIPYLREWGSKLLASVPTSKPGQGWSRSDLRGVMGNTIKPSSTEQMTYPRLEKTLAEARRLGADQEIVQHLQEIYDLDYFFDPVVSVEQGEEAVYDLNVPQGSMFVANGMTNHNTTISACIAAYETYKLLLKGDPHRYYGLPHSNVIQLISVATDKDQAGLLYREVAGHFKSCDFFSPYMANNTMSYANFQTPYDIDQYGSYADDPKARSSIKITFRSCVAKGLRGAGNILVILDEVAHFTDAGQSGADEVYQAVTPSTSAYSPKDPADKRLPIGEVEGRIILISSPLGKTGLFYDQYTLGFQPGPSENMICVQAPTWEVNPTIPAHEFEKHYLKDVRVFFTEYGAVFSDRTRGWIENEDDLLACIDPARRPRFRGRSRFPHYLGFDFAMVGDASAVAIGHVEDRNVVVDFVDSIQAGEGQYADVDRLRMEWVADWLKDLSQRFYLVNGMFDQWAGLPLEQALEDRGLTQIRAEHFTAPLSSRIYRNFYNMMQERRVVLYDWPRPVDEHGIEQHCPYIAEMLTLQAEHKSKYVTVVEAPPGRDNHDDLSDAVVRMVWLASQSIGEGRHLATGGGPRPGSLNRHPNPGSLSRARRKALLGGSSLKRMDPRKARAGGMSPYRGLVMVSHKKKKR